MNANTKKPLINYKQTLDILNKVAEQHSLKNEYETIPVTDIVGRISAEEIKSTIEVPSFNNSAMDGFAVHAQYINQQLSVVPKVKIKVTGQIQAGDGSDVFVTDDSVYAWEIMTGAPVPEMYDSVIPIEHVMVEQFNGQQFITIDKFIKTGQNVRLSGTDYRLGQEVLRKHTTLHAQHVMALATVGVSELQVLKHIPVAIFSTGNELVDRSNSTLESGKIFNSNQPFLQSFLKNITCDPVYVASCQDVEAKFEELLDLAKEQGVKIIFSTGAVSMGRYDFVPKVLKQRGATIHFHKARVRPGKPILFAEL
ncbi:Molybdopterin molybdenumtransferase, partial [hydrothermal vent metagenome]